MLPRFARSPDHVPNRGDGVRISAKIRGRYQCGVVSGGLQCTEDALVLPFRYELTSQVAA